MLSVLDYRNLEDQYRAVYEGMRQTSRVLDELSMQLTVCSDDRELKWRALSLSDAVQDMWVQQHRLLSRLSDRITEARREARREARS